MIPATQALERLKEGNQHFVSDGLSRVVADGSRRSELLNAQAPFAVILSCSDSRAPTELIFDQGLGELFVIRVAGNVAAKSQIGSVEYAVSELGTRLVVVLGHTGCGAVKATLENITQPQENPSENLGVIVSRIKPCVETLLKTDLQHDSQKLLREAVRANVRSSVQALRTGSELLESFTPDGLLIVGAEYSLETGVVEFFT